MSARTWTPLKEYKEILFDAYNGIARITINRPRYRNAFTPLTTAEISDALCYCREAQDISVVVEAGDEKLDINYCSFVHKEGVNLMGEDCVKKFEGYFPIRFNWDDSYHSTGNMSIQCHSGGEYNVKNYNEFGRQDENSTVTTRRDFLARIATTSFED